VEPIGVTSGVLLPAATTVLKAGLPPREGTTTPRELAIALSAPSEQGLELAVIVQDEPQEFDDPETSLPSDQPPSTPRAHDAIRELVLLDLPRNPDGQTDLALLAPVRLPESRLRAVLAQVQIEPGSSDEAHQARWNDACKAIEASIALAGQSQQTSTEDATEAAAAAKALAGLTDPSRRRLTLSVYAGRTGARITEDAALVMGDRDLQTLADMVQASFAQNSGDFSAPGVAWTLERTTLAMLSQKLAASQLSEELAAVLAHHTGEVGRSSSSIDDLVKSATSVDDFRARVEAENVIALEDSSPAVRVRAYDWLAARGKSPPGYDPLEDDRSRRSALEQLLAPQGAQ
jgi:hypothetical protein